jgi:hypothetical protein
MEFPPELSHHIREYAKPAFIHWKLYKQVKERVDVRHWSFLRKALQGPKATEVSQAAEEYLTAINIHQFCKDRLNSFDKSVGINRYLQCWCHETQRVVQWSPDTLTMVPVPVLTEEQETTERRWERWLVTTGVQESGGLRELLFLVYGQEWVDSDEEYVYE